MSTSRRVIVRYTLFQIPDLILLALALAAAVNWWDLSIRLAYTLFGLWLVKDIVLFPVMRVAYEQGSPANDRLTGASGIARQALDPDGYVVVGSELWKARTVSGAGPVLAGGVIRVVELEGLTLLVEPAEERGSG